MYFTVFLRTNLYVKISTWYSVWLENFLFTISLLGTFAYRLVFKDTYEVLNSKGTHARPNQTGRLDYKNLGDQRMRIFYDTGYKNLLNIICGTEGSHSYIPIIPTSSILTARFDCIAQEQI